MFSIIKKYLCPKRVVQEGQTGMFQCAATHCCLYRPL